MQSYRGTDHGMDRRPGNYSEEMMERVGEITCFNNKCNFNFFSIHLEHKQEPCKELNK